MSDYGQDLIEEVKGQLLDLEGILMSLDRISADLTPTQQMSLAYTLNQYREMIETSTKTLRETVEKRVLNSVAGKM